MDSESGLSNWTVIALLLLLGAIVLFVVVLPPSEWVPVKLFGHRLESAGGLGVVLFLALSAFATSVGFPRQVIAFIGGLAYGITFGFFLTLVAALAGCALTIYGSRRLFYRWVLSRYPLLIKRLDALLYQDVFAKVVALRLQPLGTNFITNLCVGFTSVSRPLFLLASAVGYVPQMLVFVLLGAGVRVGSDAQLLLSAVLMMLSILIGAVLLWRHKNRSIYP